MISSWTLIVFYIYCNDLPKILIGKSIPIVFTDDTSIVITNSSIVDFQSNITAVFEQLYKWFNLNLLSLSFDKINFIHLKRKNVRQNVTIDAFLTYLIQMS
jgi:hypothetical protein